ncbi:MAG: HD domain-containing protein [Spirochaetaceae bacterium]|jgi:poly(A) polymerase|nr:HD domain-containing protein [Spirochaetaceae bacterium]
MEAANVPSVSGALLFSGFDAALAGFSALDLYFGLAPLPFTWVNTGADLSELARLFEGLRFPGPGIADAALDMDGRTWYFTCLDRDLPGEPPPFSLLSFTYDCAAGCFRDPAGLYPLLRELRDGRPSLPASGEWWAANPASDRFRAAADAAVILARYCGGGSARKGELPAGEGRREEEVRLAARAAEALRGLPPALAPEAEAQRTLLCTLMLSPRPDLGLRLLRLTGFAGELWPELAALDEVDHSKEYHPEGNVWNHTLETFRYRKPSAGGAQDLRLSLGLLLHDVGKPLAASSGGKRFDGHAEIGARLARGFLQRLGFEAAFIEEIYFLVRNHMLPAALPRLPPSRTAGIIESPLFPTLMELYRCDESSSFKGPTGYYESSAAYQAYLRSRRNPYRRPDGKKIARPGV